MRTLSRIGSLTASLVPGLVVLALLAYAVLYLAGFRAVAVYSGSMEPQLNVGAVAFVQPVDSAEIRAGDVVTFQDPRTPGRLITHRVVERFTHEGELVYRTKGDANASVDPWTVELPGQVGRLAFDLPLAGYALIYAKTREVRTALILLFAGVLLAWLLHRIWRRPEPPVAAAVAPDAGPEPVVPAVAEPPAAVAATRPRGTAAKPVLVLSGLVVLWLLARLVRAPRLA